MRYLRWGGDGEAVRPEKGQGVENCLRLPQNPQRQVHALLGAVELEDSLTETRLLRQAEKYYFTYFGFMQEPKRNLLNLDSFY